MRKIEWMYQSIGQIDPAKFPTPKSRYDEHQRQKKAWHKERDQVAMANHEEKKEWQDKVEEFQNAAMGGITAFFEGRATLMIGNTPVRFHKDPVSDTDEKTMHQDTEANKDV